jgi:hypothetical protein
VAVLSGGNIEPALLAGILAAGVSDDGAGGGGAADPPGPA